MNEADDQVAQGGHDLRGIASTHPRTVFGEGNITRIMQAILDTPMSLLKSEQARGVRLLAGQIGDLIDDLLDTHRWRADAQTAVPHSCV